MIDAMDANRGGDEGLQCQWCSVTAGPDAKNCPNCGAALILRETIGDLVIPGVTHVDPAATRYAAQPLRIPRPSASQSIADPTAGAALLAGDPTGLLALGGLAAVAFQEYRAAGGGAAGRQAMDRVGLPDEIVQRMLEELEREERGAAAAGLETEANDERPATPETEHAD